MLCVLTQDIRERKKDQRKNTTYYLVEMDGTMRVVYKYCAMGENWVSIASSQIVRKVQIFIQVNGRDRAKSAEKKNNSATRWNIAKLKQKKNIYTNAPSNLIYSLFLWQPSVFIADNFKFGWAITQLRTRAHQRFVQSNQFKAQWKNKRQRKFFISHSVFYLKMYRSMWDFVQLKLPSALCIKTPHQNVKHLSSVYYLFAVCVDTYNHCRAAYTSYLIPYLITSTIQWLKFKAECFLSSFSPFLFLSISLSVSLCVSVSLLVPLMLFFFWGKKIQLNAYLIVYFNVFHSMSAHCHLG